MKLPRTALAGVVLILALPGCSRLPAATPVVTTTVLATKTVSEAPTATTVFVTISETTTVTETVTVGIPSGNSLKVFDHTKVEAGVTKILTDAPPNGYGQAGVSGTSCPSDQAVEAGATFTCTATIGGTQKQIIVTVQDDSGKYEVGVPR